MKFFIFVFLISTAILADVYKARIVDSKGRIRGYKGIRDLSLCGTDLGLARLSEGPLMDTERLRLDCSSDSRKDRNFSDLRPTRWEGSEVRTLIHQGPVQNRIDLTIVSDGYTEAEKQKFFDDAQKISDDLFGESTFATYLPLFNVHAVFVPSRESGIGDGRPNDTALGLYRDSTARQAVMCANEFAAERASRLAPDVDYPILLGNDPYYGGLGGQFAITTSAPLNITTVLRHELGHNFGRVGEEYDGGYVYSGANFSSTRNVSWRHHLRDETPMVYAMDLIHYSAPWKDISNSDFEQSFSIPKEGRVLFDFSSLGFDTSEDVEMLVDGQPTSYEGRYNYDRNFYLVEARLAAGRHSVRFHRKANDRNNIISKLAIYFVPDDFPVGTSSIGAFATYNHSGTLVGYRPTERTCLMKDMSSHQFCDICLENMWRNFLREVSLIDAVSVKNGSVQLDLIPIAADKIQVDWYDASGTHRADLNGKRSFNYSEQDKGRWTVKVSFVSDEVKDPRRESYTVHRKQVAL